MFTAEKSPKSLETSRCIAQSYLKPGETLLWAGQGIKKPPLWVAAITFLVCLLFGVLAAYTLAHTSRSPAGMPAFQPPADPMFSPWTPFCFLTGLGVLFSGIVIAVLFSTTKSPPYAVTDRRILFLSPAASGQSTLVAEYGPEDIQFIRRQDHRNGTSDLFFRRNDLDGLRVTLLSPDIGLLGIADAEVVKPLMAALQAKQGTNATPAHAHLELSDEGEMKFQKPVISRWVGVACVLLGSVCIGITLSVRLGIITAINASGAPASPADGFVLAAFGLFFALVGFYLLLWREWLTIDRVAQTYQMQRGLLPFAKSTTGNVAEFDCLRIVRQQHSEGEGGSYLAWHIRLLWRGNRRRPYELLMTNSALSAREEGRRIAAALSLPLEDHSA